MTSRNYVPEATIKLAVSFLPQTEKVALWICFASFLMVSESNCNMGWLRNYSAYKNMWGIPKSILIACEKNIYCSKLVLLKSSYCLLWNILLTGVVSLMIDICNYSPSKTVWWTLITSSYKELNDSLTNWLKLYHLWFIV